MSCSTSPVTIRGVKYPTQAAAAEALGVAPEVVAIAKQECRLNAVGLPAQSVTRLVEPEPKPVPAAKPKPRKSVVSGGGRFSPAELSGISHPLWSSSEDHALLMARVSGQHFSQIADHLGRNRIAVEQRWHRLRVVAQVVAKLKAYGLIKAAYPPHDAAEKSAAPLPKARVCAP